MKVVGLDLSVAATGTCDRDGKLFTIKPGFKGDWRLVEIRDCIELMVGGCDLVVIEELPPVRAHALGILGMVHGAVRSMLMMDNIRYALAPPTVLKKYATGRGQATKPDMRMALFQRTDLDVRDDNQVDAYWLRAMGLDQLGEPVVKLPEAQRAALSKVAWPVMS